VEIEAKPSHLDVNRLGDKGMRHAGSERRESAAASERKQSLFCFTSQIPACVTVDTIERARSAAMTTLPSSAGPPHSVAALESRIFCA
jgi:hypothetical protein